MDRSEDGDGGAALAEADYASLAAIRHALRGFLAFSEDRAAAAGLTPQQHQALLAIRAAEAGAVTVGWLAERLYLKPHSATGLIDRLVAGGLVTRAVAADDRRRAVLALTPRAEVLLEGLSGAHREELRRLRPLLVSLLERI